MKEKSRDVMRIEIIRTIDDSYDLVFNHDFPRIAYDLVARVKKSELPKRVAIITDTNVGPLYAGELTSSLKSAGIESSVFDFEAGEENKTLKTAEMLSNKLAQAKYGRDCFVIALGGGVVGDTAGFVAGITRRGVPYVQIPTSTLAMADSSIGGKTGVDLETGKNLVGLFKQPAVVYFNFRTLETLDPRHYRAGFAETIKHGVINNSHFFDYLGNNITQILNKNPAVLTEISRNNCMIKGTVVEKDPEEKSLRRILNYGHTAGHAIETLSNYQLPHGECVSIGMMVAGRIATALGTGFTESDLERQAQLLDAFGLPLTIPDGISNSDIIEVTIVDKKAKDGNARYCLPSRLGRMDEFGKVYAMHVDNAIVEAALNQTR